MKKITGLLLVFAMSISLIACSGNTEGTTGETETSAQTEISEETVSGGASKEVVYQEAYTVVEAEVGQPIQIDAKYGSYQITVTGVEEVDWWYRKHETNAKHVVLLHFEVENLNFSSAFSSGVKLDTDNFRVTGNNDYVGKAFPTYYDGYEKIGMVEPGEKISGTYAYELENPNRMPEYYYVVFKNSSGDIAKVKVDL